MESFAELLAQMEQKQREMKDSTAGLPSCGTYSDACKWHTKDGKCRCATGCNFKGKPSPFGYGD